MAGRIVVGVDGSDESAAALRFAVEEAGFRTATVVAVHAWRFVPPAAVGEPGVIPIAATGLMDDLTLAREGAEQMLSDAVDAAVGDASVELYAAEGSAQEVLVEASATADLVVVGTRGRGGIKSALLGSVSQHVVQHAACPVVLVRG